jgi:hypothetical protein
MKPEDDPQDPDNDPEEEDEACPQPANVLRIRGESLPGDDAS